MGETKFPWVRWLRSTEGKDAANFDTLTRGPYLENRLWRAFMAGQEAGRKDALQETTNE